MAEIFFSEQKNGYDKEQVDNYIRRLTEAYQTAYKAYLTVSEKYTDLKLDFKKLKSEIKSGAETNSIERTLMDSEKLAKDIINDAYNEEARIVAQTKNNLDYVYKTVEKAINEALRFLDSQQQ